MSLFERPYRSNDAPAVCHIRATAKAVRGRQRGCSSATDIADCQAASASRLPPVCTWDDAATRAVPTAPWSWEITRYERSVSFGRGRLFGGQQRAAGEAADRVGGHADGRPFRQRPVARRASQLP